MKLGLGSIAFIYDNINNGHFEHSNDLLLNAAKRTLDYAEKYGLKIVELMLDPPEILLDEKRYEFIELCENYPSIEKQFHAPYTYLSLITQNPWILNATIECYVECAKILTQIGGNKFTFHPGDGKFLQRSYNNYENKLLESSTRFLDKISGFNLIPCIENLPKFCNFFQYFDEITKFFDEIHRNDINLTWDTGHYWSCNNNHFEDLWDAMGKKIKNIHLVDNFETISDTHPCLGKGMVDFELVFELTTSHNYNESMIIELHRSEDLCESIDYIRNYF